MTPISKKQRISPEDRISALTDHLLYHILSSLELKDVIRTSLLSRRWRTLWTSIPTLDLGTWPAGTDKKIATVLTFFLLHYDNPKIKKFRAHFHCEDLTDYHVNSWIRFAVKRDVEELDLSLYDAVYWEIYGPVQLMDGLRYKILGRQLNCRSLKVLRLTFCELNLHLLNLCSLEELELYNVWLSDLDTSGCPALKSLILKDCNTEGHLNIYAPNEKLQCLKIHDIYRVVFHAHSAVTIFAPNVQSVQLSGCFRHFYDVKNLSSLKSASLQVHEMDDYLAKSETTIHLVKLFQHVIPVPNLQLCDWCIKVLYNWEIKGVKLPPFRATRMKLDTYFYRSELLEMTSLLRNAPYLESLTLDIRPSTGLSRESWGFMSSLAYTLSTIQDLKTIEILNFLGSGSSSLCEDSGPIGNIRKFMNESEKEIKLVKLLFRSCMVLEKMNISTVEIPSWPMKMEYLLALERRLLALRRASKNVELCISLRI